MVQHITSIQNERVKQWKKLLQPKGRKTQQKYLLEGWHLVEEAQKANQLFECIATQEAYDKYASYINVPVYIVTNEIVNALSDTQTSQHIFGVSPLAYCKQPFEQGQYILLDALQDPGNVGTIIRTADAFGFNGVILGDDCVDVFNGKTVRSMQGSQFHIPIYKMPLPQAISTLKKLNHTIYGTQLDKHAKLLDTVPKRKHVAFIVGNEGSGVHPDILALTDMNIYISMTGQAESLNVSVASSIVMYHFMRREK